MRRPRPTPLRVVAGLAGLAGLVGLFALLYAASVHGFAGDSDGATVVLEGQALAHGHPLLSGWAISLDSFWTVDALFYLGGVAVHGVNPDLLHAVPAALAAAVVALGALMAAEGRRGAAAVAAVVTVVAVLGLPSHALSYFFLRGPLHIGTALWCLVAFFGLRRARYGLGFAVAVVFLAAGLLGDLQTLALGVVPVLLAGLVAMARARRWRAGMPLVAAAAGSVVVAEVVRRAAHALGTFSIAPANPIATVGQMLRNLRHGAHEGVTLLGVGNGYYGLGGEPRALSLVHLVTVAVLFVAVVGAAAAVAWGAIRGRSALIGAPRRTWTGGGAARTAAVESCSLDDLLVFATFASPVAFVILAATPDPEYGRYLTAGVVFATVLAGRVVGRVASRLTEGESPTSVPAAPGLLNGSAPRPVPGYPAPTAAPVHATGSGAVAVAGSGPGTEAAPRDRVAGPPRTVALHRSEAGGSGRRRLLAATAVAAAAGVMAAFAAGFAFELAQPPPSNGVAVLSAFLERHHLVEGVGAYWSASVTTVQSGGAVEVRPVVLSSSTGRLVRYDRNSAADWYEKGFRFLVFDLTAPWGGVSWQAAVHSFGVPSQAYTVAGTYRVMVWPKPFRVAPGLPSTP